MDGWLIWVAAGLLALGGELLLPGAYLLWVGVAAIGTGLLLLAAAPGFGVTVVVFVVLLAAGIAWSLRRPARAPAGLNTPEAGLVGREGVLLPARNGVGLRVRLGDSDWPARLSGPEPAPGTRVRVEAVDGLTLCVRPE
ncbi:NfeD family protein [Roseomonas sp. BN140053]|uniref:NfeD family protein n=1 Tax=Roseomonas sp. BN140053 TaxID=3391898 RepID=UPI0039E99CA5